jgi:hypothetical protein
MKSRIREPKEQTKDFTLKYKRYAKPYTSPTGTNRTNEGLHIKVQKVCKAYMSLTGTNKGLHIKVQKVCKAVYEPHRDKQRTSH